MNPLRTTAFVLALAGCVDGTVPSDPGALEFTSISAGHTHTCGMAGTEVYCWGNNAGGQTGTGTEPVNPVPLAVLTRPVTLASVTTGNSISCATIVTGEPLCWGEGNRAARTVPGAPPLSRIAAGDFACGVAADSTAVCWDGPGAAAQTVSSERRFIALSVGGSACGLVADSTAVCWDQGSTTSIQLDAAQRFASLAMGESHGCGLTADGTALCWGANDVGQLGDNSSVSRPGPAPIAGALAFIELSSGGDYTCGLTVLGETHCWGDMPWLDFNLRFPVRAAIGTAFSTIDAGGSHVCGRSMENAALCWGQNESGQLGDGTTEFRPNPVPVDGVR